VVVKHPFGPTPGAVILILVSVLVTIVLLAGFTIYTQQVSDHRWCTTLTLLTSQRVPKPADPAANPSREESYRLYSDFVKLRRDLGC
jgi:hypothetical protein